MTEKFDVKLKKVCPACSSDCVNLELETEYRDFVTCANDFKMRKNVCRNEQLCFNCWMNSVRALNRIGNDVPMRTTWK